MFKNIYTEKGFWSKMTATDEKERKKEQTLLGQ